MSNTYILISLNKYLNDLAGTKLSCNKILVYKKTMWAEDKLHPNQINTEIV